MYHINVGVIADPVGQYDIPSSECIVSYASLWVVWIDVNEQNTLGAHVTITLGANVTNALRVNPLQRNFPIDTH